MAKALTKSQIMTKLSEKCDMKKKHVVMVIEELVGLAYKGGNIQRADSMRIDPFLLLF